MSVQETKNEREEILSIRIILTHNESRISGNMRTVYLFLPDIARRTIFAEPYFPAGVTHRNLWMMP